MDNVIGKSNVHIYIYIYMYIYTHTYIDGREGIFRLAPSGASISYVVLSGQGEKQRAEDRTVQHWGPMLSMARFDLNPSRRRDHGTGLDRDIHRVGRVPLWWRGRRGDAKGSPGSRCRSAREPVRTRE